MFFSAIRRMGGYNNNPTTTQFKSAYKKILINGLSIAISPSENCLPRDETLLISDEKQMLQESEKLKFIVRKAQGKGGQKAVIKKKRVRSPRPPKTPPINAVDFLQKVCPSDDWVHTDFCEETVKHIAGSIVSAIEPRINCKTCWKLLLACNTRDQDHKSKLTLKKDWVNKSGDVEKSKDVEKSTETDEKGLNSTSKRGRGLIYPSDDVNSICRRAEKVIRRCENLYTRDINFRVIKETLEMLLSSILDDGDHYKSQEPLMDHRNQLILIIIQKYIDLRLKHECMSVRDAIVRCRTMNNKLTHFKGQ